MSDFARGIVFGSCLWAALLYAAYLYVHQHALAALSGLFTGLANGCKYKSVIVVIDGVHQALPFRVIADCIDRGSLCEHEVHPHDDHGRPLGGAS